MNVKMAKRLLSGALAVVLTLAPNMGVFAATAKGTVSGETAQVVEAFPTAKSTSTVAGIKSSVGGVFILEKGLGIATLTGASDVAARYALPNGARPFVKAYDMDVKKSNLAKASLDAAAAALGATPYGYLNFELGMMQKGEYSLLAGGQGIDAALTIPTRFGQGGSYAVIVVQEGGVVTVLRDTTPDNNVITATLPAGRCALALVKIG